VPLFGSLKTSVSKDIHVSIIIADQDRPMNRAFCDFTGLYGEPAPFCPRKETNYL